ncbi:vacuolar protein sorting-associated protein 33A-like isoform X2 [Halichondria panicea]
MKAPHCITKLEESGLYHDSKGPIQFFVDEFHMEMLPMDHDVISLGLNSAFTDMYIDNDPTPLFLVAKAICKIQALYGIIPRVFGKGKKAKTVSDLMERMRREMFSNMTPEREVAPHIDTIILLDRSVDLLTPLSTQLTYEGLVDEIYGIKHNVARFPRHTFSEEFQQKPTKAGAAPLSPQLPILLTSEESMFVEMRDLNFASVGHFLSKEAKKITEAYNERHDAKTVSQLKQFVQKLPHMTAQKTSLSKHTTIAELIKHVTDDRYFLEQIYAEQQLREEDFSDRACEYIEKCIGNLEPIAKVLRLICMQSVANSGLKPKILEYYKRNIVQAYGYEHLISLHHLETAGLLRLQGDKRVFPQLRKQLKLIPGTVDDKEPKDISYVFSGYAPLSVRLVELFEKPQGWGTFEEVTRALPGPPAFALSQPVSKAQEKRQRPTVDRPLIVLVFFLGGCSYAEISALRFRSQMEGATTEYIVGTTHVTTGYSLLNSVLTQTPGFMASRLWDNQLDASDKSGNESTES